VLVVDADRIEGERGDSTSGVVVAGGVVGERLDTGSDIEGAGSVGAECEGTESGIGGGRVGVGVEVRIYWLPKHASWLDQVEIIFSKVQRDLLTHSDFPSLAALEHDLAAYFAELNTHPKPIKWTYTKTKLLAKFEALPLQLAA
jgi:hypothetical protein